MLSGVALYQLLRYTKFCTVDAGQQRAPTRVLCCGLAVCGSLQGRLTLLRPRKLAAQDVLDQQRGQDTSANGDSHVAVPPVGPAQQSF